MKRCKTGRFVYMLAVALFLCATKVSANESWGVHFRKNGEPPECSATAEYLAQYNAYYIGAGDEKIVYLTFDAGYENGLTAGILDTLKKHDVPAAFFLVGTYIRDQPELIKRMVAEGHIVANHTMSHPDMSRIGSKSAFEKELALVEDVYRTVTGAEIPRYYRPPRGTYSETNLKHAHELGYATVFWSLAYRDWENDNQPTRQEAFKKLVPRIHPGAVILLHNTSKTNALILDELLTQYKEMGYRFEGLDALVGKGKGVLED